MRGTIEWFARNGVAANLLMVVIVAGGLFTISQNRREVFPETSADMITVRVPYPGAAPEEVEEGVCIRIEEEIQEIEGIKRLSSTATEGLGVVRVELETDADVDKVLDDVKARVDAIDTFPEEAEQPVIAEVVFRRQAINVAVFGPAGERTLRQLGERVRDDLLRLPTVTQASLAGARPYEISIEVSDQALSRYGLTFEDVAAAVRRSSIDLPGGSVRTRAGEILLRTEGQAKRDLEFERIVVRAGAGGERLLLADIATVVDGFEETDQSIRFDGQPAVIIQVSRVGNQDVTKIANAVKAYVEASASRLPEGVKAAVWADDTRVLQSRLDTLVRNGRTGLLLGVGVLALFLRLRLAGWVSLGIPVSFLGAFWLMPSFDLTINMISLFAFIVVLGIVVDDAIVVGENIFYHLEQGEAGLDAAIKGVEEVSVPVVFAVLTTIAAFSPLLGVAGTMGKFMRVIPSIVIITLIFSLIESLWVLPAHLSHLDGRERPPAAGIRGSWSRFRRRFSAGLQQFVERRYRPLLDRAIEWRYLTVALGVALLLVTGGLVAGGWIKYSFFPPAEADNIVAAIEMPPGVAPEVTAAATRRLETAALEVVEEIEAESGAGTVYRHVMASTGEQPFRSIQSQNGGGVGTTFVGSHLAEVNIELAPAELRPVTAAQIAERWREAVGTIPEAVELSFTSEIFSSGSPIHVELAAPDLDELRLVSARLQDRLAQYPGVIDITDSFRAGKREVSIDVTPAGEALGLSRAGVARQVRQAFFGEEAQRILRGRDEIKVMVRYPEDRRRSLADLERMRLRTSDGAEVPFSVAATMSYGRGFAAIERTNRQRTVTVTADLREDGPTAGEVLADLDREFLPGLVAENPGLSYSFEGEQQQQRDTIGGLKRGFALALLAIYVLMAVPFKSYVQPLIVMTAIPFGIIGAVWGHVLMGKGLTILSLFGVVALAGVVVNDSLVMVDFINRARASGTSFAEAIRSAGERRFRAILLTSLTTFVGLLPLLLERSVQAQFLIPMAISLAFGVLFATGITLVLVPVTYVILEDVRAVFRRFIGGGLLASESERPSSGWEADTRPGVSAPDAAAQAADEGAPA